MKNFVIVDNKTTEQVAATRITFVILAVMFLAMIFVVNGVNNSKIYAPTTTVTELLITC